MTKLLGLYDESTMFLAQMNVFRGKGVTDSHELAVFLQLHGANSWVQIKTGNLCTSVATLLTYQLLQVFHLSLNSIW